MSCKDDDIIWDYAGISIYIKVKNTEGKDLLNPNTPNNLVNSDIISFQNDNITIPVIWDINEYERPESQYYLAYLHSAIYREETLWK